MLNTITSLKQNYSSPAVQSKRGTMEKANKKYITEKKSQTFIYKFSYCFFSLLNLNFSKARGQIKEGKKLHLST